MIVPRRGGLDSSGGAVAGAQLGAVSELSCCVSLQTGQEVQAPGSAAQEDSGHAAQAQQARGEPEDQEAAAKGTFIPAQEICHQGIAQSKLQLRAGGLGMAH